MAVADKTPEFVGFGISAVILYIIIFFPMEFTNNL